MQDHVPQGGPELNPSPSPAPEPTPVSPNQGQFPLPDDPEQQPTRRVNSTVIVIIGILALLVLGHLLTPNNASDENASDAQPQEQREERQATEEVSTDTVDPNEFAERDQAHASINQSQGKPVTGPNAERIVPGVIEDGDQEDVVYFATSNANAAEHFVGVYSYNTQTRRWHRLIKRTFTPNDDGVTSMLRVIGKEGRNLILFQDRLDRTPQPCHSDWLTGAEENALFSIDLDNLRDGLSTYKLASDTRSEEETRVSTCQNKL